MDKRRSMQVVRPRVLTGCLAPVFAMGCATAYGQSVFVPSVDYGQKVPTVEQSSLSQIGSVSAPPLRQAGPAETYPLNWGPIQFHPHLSYQAVYGDGVLSDTNGPQKTLLHTVSPGALFALGRYWDFDFTASFNRYSNAKFNDSEAYTAALRGTVPLERWLLSLNYVGSLTEQPQVESGGTQTLQNSQRVAVGGIYNYNTRFSVELGLSQDVLLTENFANYWTWSTDEWLNYHVTTKTSVALGIGGGYNLVDPGVDWTFERVQGRLLWHPGPKLNFQLIGGAQFQQFRSDNNPDDPSGTFTSPLFAAAVSYQPIEPTVLSFSASHEVGNSFLTGLFTETTTVTAGLRQRLFRHFSVIAQPTYVFRQYKNTFGNLSTEREDDYFSIYAGVNVLLFKKLNLTGFYQFTDNSSSRDEFSFESTQVGVRLDYRY